MALETFSGIWSFVIQNPLSTDDQGQGDDHIRGIKQGVRATWPNVSATAECTHTELNHLVGVSSNLNTALSSEIARNDAQSASLATIIGYGSMSFAESTSEISANTTFTIYTGWGTPGPTKRASVSTASGHIMVVKEGVYQVNASLAISASTGATITMLLLHNDATSVYRTSAKLAANDLAPITLNAHISASASAELKIALTSTATTSITPKHGQFSAKRIG